MQPHAPSRAPCACGPCARAARATAPEQLADAYALARRVAADDPRAVGPLRTVREALASLATARGVHPRTTQLVQRPGALEATECDAATGIPLKELAAAGMSGVAHELSVASAPAASECPR